MCCIMKCSNEHATALILSKYKIHSQGTLQYSQTDGGLVRLHTPVWFFFNVTCTFPQLSFLLFFLCRTAGTWCTSFCRFSGYRNQLFVCITEIEAEVYVWIYHLAHLRFNTRWTGIVSVSCLMAVCKWQDIKVGAELDRRGKFTVDVAQKKSATECNRGRHSSHSLATQHATSPL